MEYNTRRLDKTILFCFIVLLIWGVFMVFSTTSYKDSGSKPYIINQLLATVLGIIGIVVTLKFRSETIEKLTVPSYIISIIMLIWVLLHGIGEVEWGAKSWIRFKFLGFQPSELAKIGYILFLSKYISKRERKINDVRNLLKIFIVASIPILLIMMQPDFGTVLVYLFVLLIMILSANINKRYIGLSMILMSITTPVLWTRLSNYQKNRIYNFINPSFDVNESGYQVTQSKLAIKTSGLFGKGLIRIKGIPFIEVPENHNDFIFSAVVESFGIIGGIIMILLFIVIIYKILKRSNDIPNRFQSYALKGFSALLFFHFFESVAMTMGAMPVTGIPLPFISYGGTFQLTNLIIMGLILKFTSYETASTLSNNFIKNK